jgi:hypothetical protein
VDVARKCVCECMPTRTVAVVLCVVPCANRAARASKHYLWWAPCVVSRSTRKHAELVERGVVMVLHKKCV